MGNYVFDYVEVEIDEPVLQEIAEITEGKYFRATDKNSLEEVYKEIDKLEKDKISVIEYQVEIPEKFYNFVLLGLLSLLFSVALSKIIFRTTP